MKPTIRRARHLDLKGIMALENRCFDPVDAFSESRFCYLLRVSRSPFYVAREDGKLIAYMSLLHNERHTNLRIYSIAVAPEARGRGIASRLIDIARRYAKERRLRTVTLEVRTTNEVAIKAYEKMGFTKKVLKENYYSDGGAAHGMSLSVM